MINDFQRYQEMDAEPTAELVDTVHKMERGYGDNDTNEQKFVDDFDKRATEKWGSEEGHRRLWNDAAQYRYTSWTKEEWWPMMLVEDKYALPPVVRYREIRPEMTGFDEFSDGSCVPVPTEQAESARRYTLEDEFQDSETERLLEERRELERKDPRKMNQFHGFGMKGIIANAAHMDVAKSLVPEEFEYRRLDETYRHWFEMPEDERVYLGVYPRRAEWGDMYQFRRGGRRANLGRGGHRGPGRSASASPRPVAEDNSELNFAQ